MTKHHAECQCGQLAVESDADPDFVIACNCQACQKRTGSPFGTGLYFKKSDLTTSGESATWARTADSGLGLCNHFCPKCGTTLYWTLELRPDHMGVAYGCFDTPVPDPKRVVWAEEQHAWVRFPDGIETFSKGSPR